MYICYQRHQNWHARIFEKRGRKMITNILLLKLKDRENIAAAKDKLLGMKGKIEFLRGLRVETDVRHGASSYDIALIVEYDSMEDLNAYLVHPIHVEVGKYIGGVIESQAAVCYES
jgi:hypothetical protein